MLNPQEHTLVITTLKQRHAWLNKALKDGKVDEEQRKTMQVLESAIKKLANTVSTAQSAENNSTESDQKPAKTLETARVLIAEDQQDSRQLLMDLLEDIGLKHVDEAKDGREAFDAIKNSELPYDIILCDWEMPELSGIEVHRKAKGSNTLRNAYFCMVTGMSESDKIRKAISEGVNDYIVKPIDGAILEGKIKSVLNIK